MIACFSELRLKMIQKWNCKVNPVVPFHSIFVIMNVVDVHIFVVSLGVHKQNEPDCKPSGTFLHAWH